MSLGDIATNALSGNPGAQMAQALAGPQPGAQGGGGQQGAMNPSPAPAMAQPQATQSPPDLAKLYMQLYNQQRGAATFDQGLSGLQAAFAPPGQQAAWLAHGNQGGRQDPGAMLQNLMQLRNQQAYQSALPDMLKAAGLDPNLTPLARADPGFLTKAIESQTGIGAPLEQRQYLAAKNAAAAAGQQFPDFPTWQNQNKAAGATMEEADKNKQGAKDTFATLDQTYKTAEDNAQWLQSHPDALVKAVQWGQAANGRVGQIASGFGLLDQDTADARARLDQLNDENFRKGMADTKNIRSLTEANKIGGSMSSLDRPANSRDMILSEAESADHNDSSRARQPHRRRRQGGSLPVQRHGRLELPRSQEHEYVQRGDDGEARHHDQVAWRRGQAAVRPSVRHP